MKRKNERIISFLLVCTVMLSLLLTGCENGGGNATVDNTGESSADGNDSTEKTAETLTSSGKVFGYELIDNDRYNDITIMRDVTEENLIESCKCNSVPAAYSDYNDTFYVSIEKGNNFSDYSMLFTSSPETEIYAVKMSYDSFDGTLDEAVAKGYNFLFLAVKGDYTHIYHIVMTYLPIMTITGDGDSTYNPNVTDANPFHSEREANMTFQTPDEYYESMTYIHQRGGSSRCFPKTGYRLNLRSSDGSNNKLNLNGMRKDDDWILLPLYTDESKIRDKMSMDLWLDMVQDTNSDGEKFGTKIEYIELLIDGCYWGVYGLTVPVDAKMADTDEENNEFLVKTESWDIPSSGELLYGGESKSIGSLTIKEPDPPTQDNWDVLSDFMKIVYESSDKTFGERITEYLSIETAVDHWIFVNMISGVDNAWKNMFMSFKRDGSGYKIQLCPWDCDISWGVTWTGETELFWDRDMDYLVSWLGGDEALGGRMLYTVEGASDYLVQRWGELRKGLLSQEALFERVDSLTETLRGCGAYSREVKRWPDGGHITDTENKYIKEFITRRLEFLDEYVAQYE